MSRNVLDLDAIAEECMSLGEKYIVEGDPGEAFMSFLKALIIKPGLKDELKMPIASVLCDWGKILEFHGRYDFLLSFYKKALDFYPDNEIILNNLGAHLCRSRYPMKSMEYFYKALEVNNNYLPAYSNLQNTKSLLVERWHFRMLNDTLRNKSYQRAITNKIAEGHKSILDIGSGTGILSIYAKRAGADKVFGCDYSETMITIANQVINACEVLDSVILINKLSNDLSIPEDIPDRMSLVVTETFDAGLLGEHILETLIHAWEHLLRPNNDCINQKRVIPGAATIYIVPIESIKIAKKNYIIKGRRQERQSFKLGIDLKRLNVLSSFDEPYDTENLKQVPYTCLAQPLKLFTFDFNNLSELKKYYDGEITRNFNMEIIKDGYLDAFAVWFDLNLDDENVITSSPLLENRCCWEQAVFPVKREWHVTEKTVISLYSSCVQGILSIEFQNNPLFGIVETKLIIPPPILSFLNCETILLTYIKICNKVKESLTEQSFILEVSSFPYLSILLALHCGCKLFFSNPNEEIIHAVEKLLRDLDLNLKISTLKWSNVLELPEEDTDTKFNLIYTDILEANGQINEEIICAFPHLRSILSSEGLFLPSKLTFYGQFVSSEELARASKVNPSTDELNIAEFINEYKMDQMIDINIHETEYEAMSDTFEIVNLYLSDWKDETLHFEKVEAIKKAGSVNSLLYWFNYGFLDDIHFNTSSKVSYINHSAVVLDEPIQVNDNSKLKVTLDLYTSIMRFGVTAAE